MQSKQVTSLRRAWFILRHPRAYLRSIRIDAADRMAFDEVEAYCLFIGYPRSGGSLLGSLLNAHPNIVISHELSALAFVQHGFTRDQVYALILERDRAFTRSGRTWTGYTYAVPDAYEGRFDALTVIGDKKAAIAVRRLDAHPELLDLLRDTMRVKLRVVHNVRNPFDNISTISRRSDLPMEKATEFYFKLCDAALRVMKRLDPGELIEVRHEATVLEPRKELRRITECLGLGCSESYLDACCKVIFEKPRRTRQEAGWTEDLVKDVAERCERYPFLANYHFED